MAITPIDTTFTQRLRQAPSAAAKTEVLFHYMRSRGQSHYDESVTQLEHALQCAHLAQNAGGDREQVVAALLHDFGHFLTDEHDTNSNFQEDDWYHEEVAAVALAEFLPESIVAAIRLHVAAKRYLCTVEPAYKHGLSPASQRSFELQGGPMSQEELTAFRNEPFYELAVRIRRWDDGGKLPDWQVPDLDAYRQDMDQLWC